MPIPANYYYCVNFEIFQDAHVTCTYSHIKVSDLDTYFYVMEDIFWVVGNVMTDKILKNNKKLFNGLQSMLFKNYFLNYTYIVYILSLICFKNKNKHHYEHLV